MTVTRASEAWVQGIVPDDVVIRGASIGASDLPLPPEEAEAVARAAAPRRAEFATGRTLARAALAELGRPTTALARDEDRVPRWPADVVGSITHTRREAGPGGASEGTGPGLCVAAVGWADRYVGIGLDVEPCAPVREGVERMVCSEAERDWVALDRDSAGIRTRMVFSVKEAVYKAFYPRLREFWGFDRVSVEIELDAEVFRARVPASTGREFVTGHLVTRNGWILSSVAVPVTGGPGC